MVSLSAPIRNPVPPRYRTALTGIYLTLLILSIYPLANIGTAPTSPAQIPWFIYVIYFLYAAAVWLGGVEGKFNGKSFKIGRGMLLFLLLALLNPIGLCFVGIFGGVPGALITVVSIFTYFAVTSSNPQYKDAISGPARVTFPKKD